MGGLKSGGGDGDQRLALQHTMHAQGGTRRFADRLNALLISRRERHQGAGSVRRPSGGARLITHTEECLIRRLLP